MENSDPIIAPEPSEQPEPQLSLLARQIKALKLLLETETVLIVIVLAVVLGLGVFFLRTRTNSVTPAPSPIVIISSPEPSVIPDRTISEFAKTETFGQFEKKLDQLNQESQTVDLTETELSFPFLDMNVNFTR